VTRPRHPAGTYVALYGSHGGDWRERAKALLDAAGVPWHDPTDPRWDGITHADGDRHQELIDRLVAEEHEGLFGAACAVFHLAGGAEPPASLAARFELGLLAGRGLPTFVHVDARALGRNYVWAAVKLHQGLTACRTLEEAVERAIERARRANSSAV
jgi:hypothetical protein